MLKLKTNYKISGTRIQNGRFHPKVLSTEKGKNNDKLLYGIHTYLYF